MAGFNAGNPALPNMPIPNNAPNGTMRLPDDRSEETSYESKLNRFIYGYLLHTGQYDAARILKNSGIPFDPPLVDRDVNGVDENMHTDSKDNIDKKRPSDLPDADDQTHGLGGGNFLLNWFSVFWDVYFAQRKDHRASKNSLQYVQQTQQQARMRQNQQQQMFQNAPMVNNQLEYNMMRFPNGMNLSGDLRQRALQNNNRMGGPTQQQIHQMRMAQLAPGQARRDPAMDMNGQRPRSPAAGDHAPSPSKRQRMDGVPFDSSQMMPNGRGLPQGMPPGMMGGDVAAVNANNLLMNNGINPGNLSDFQFQSFQQQNPTVQQKSIQVYAQNLAKNQRQQSMSNAGGVSDQGSPIVDPGLGELGNAEFYGAGNAAAMSMRGGAPPNVPNGGAGGNHALQDYQMQLMLLEQQNKKRLLMARQEQDTIGGRPDGQPGMPGGPNFMAGMSPGSREGPSPGPSDTKRGTPKMNQVGLPGGGSPMPDGSMRGSPAAMNFNPMNPDMYAQMNGNGMRPPPSSNPGFPGQPFNHQQVDQMARQQAAERGMPNGWQPPQGQPQMMGQPQPAQQPQQQQQQQQQSAPMGTPQTRNTDMPPPGVPNTGANGRPASPAPPTPQTANKPAPKGKKETRDRKKQPKKNPNASTAPTPVSEAETANPPTPTPATPSTPQNASSFSVPKAESQGQPNMIQGMVNGGAEQIPPQPDQNTMQLGGFEQAPEDLYGMPFNSDLNNPDLLENFDFEQFLQNTDAADFQFDPSTLDGGDMEAGMAGT